MRPTVTCADKLDAFVNKFNRYIVGLRPSVGQTVESFCRDWNRAVTRLRDEVGFDMRFRWSLKLATWVEHLHRHHDHPGYSFLQCQTDDWLRERRRDVGRFSVLRNEDAGATQTRAGPGFPNRWGSCWLALVGDTEQGWNNASRAKTESKRRETIIQNKMLVRTTRNLALANA